MEERVTTSFIPKTSLETPELRRPRGNPAALANIVCAAILILAIAGAGGVYFFQTFTASQIVSKQTSLAHSREAFEPATIKELARLDTRIETAKTLLKQHISVSTLFDELERATLSSVRYTNFQYSVVAPGHVLLSMSGQAASYNAVALQSEAFSKSSIITDPIFSDVNVNKDGAITFDFTGVIDTSRMLYTPSSSSNNAAAPSAPSSGAVSTTTTP